MSTPTVGKLALQVEEQGNEVEMLARGLAEAMREVRDIHAVAEGVAESLRRIDAVAENMHALASRIASVERRSENRDERVAQLIGLIATVAGQSSLERDLRRHLRSVT